MEIIDEESPMRKWEEGSSQKPFDLTEFLSSIHYSPEVIGIKRGEGSTNKAMLEWLITPNASGTPSARTERPQVPV